VPLRSAIGLAWAGVAGEDFEVLSAERHRRKLKRGALRGNAFEIRLRDFAGDPDLLQQRLRTIAVAGVPGYFGPQRFGRAGHNVEVAQQWFSAGAPPRDRVERSFALSAARAVIFNAVLAERIGAGTWDQLQAGEIVNLNGSGSIFTAAVIDEALRERCRLLDIHPTGPLWGAGSATATGESAELERRVADRCGVLASGLDAQPLEPERRALRAAVEDLQWTVAGSDVQLRFRLTRGAFATAVLHELLDNAFVQEMPEADES
jgi:tRNA pseudouridine13 synthase